MDIIKFFDCETDHFVLLFMQFRNSLTKIKGIHGRIYKGYKEISSIRQLLFDAVKLNFLIYARKELLTIPHYNRKCFLQVFCFFTM